MGGFFTVADVAGLSLCLNQQRRILRQSLGSYLYLVKIKIALPYEPAAFWFSCVLVVCLHFVYLNAAFEEESRWDSNTVKWILDGEK